jgi:hypothetical protein
MYDFSDAIITLKDDGCFIFGPRQNDPWPGWCDIERLRIFDEREDSSQPAITLHNLRTPRLNRCSVNGAGLALRIDHCHDVRLENTTLIHGLTGLEIRGNTNRVTASNLVVEQMTGVYILARDSVMLHFDRSCKLHGIPDDSTPRCMVQLGNCGSVWLESQIMHAVPHASNGLVLVYGSRWTENIILRPWIMRSGDGPVAVLRNVPPELEYVIEPVNMRRQSLKNPKVRS